MCSSIMFTANATSRSTRWDCVGAIRWINSDFVIRPLSHRTRRHVLGRAMALTSPFEAVSRCRFLPDESTVRPTRGGAAAPPCDHQFTPSGPSSGQRDGCSGMRSRDRAWCRGSEHAGCTGASLDPHATSEGAFPHAPDRPIGSARRVKRRVEQMRRNTAANTATFVGCHSSSARLSVGTIHERSRFRVIPAFRGPRSICAIARRARRRGLIADRKLSGPI